MALDPEVASINDDCILKFTVRAAENCGLGSRRGIGVRAVRLGVSSLKLYSDFGVFLETV